MKQTSLFQSWTRTSIPGYCVQSTSGSNQLTSAGAPKSPHNLLYDDSDDQLLAAALDSYAASANPVTTTSPDQLESLLTTLHARPPITYRATGNDSDHLDGFDVESGRYWIYPLNAAFRAYQFHITEQCLFKNTLVCLPTGLGKTFVAAVVMHNFLRWYPAAKVVFMAPTRPLVTQQLSACRQFTGLSSSSVVELTGSTPQLKRQQLWKEMRVFFMTPQVLVNDLKVNICPSSDVRLLVFDEAHKATGNHAYCQALRLLTSPPHERRQFRIVALTATPAADIQGVQAVIANLLISHLELRTESSADIKLYTQHRQLETVVVSLGPELSRFRNQLVECVRIPLERLRLRGALHPGLGDLRPDHIAKFTVIKARGDWSSGPLSAQLSSADAGSVQCDFGTVICLLHCIELLDHHGLRPLYQYLSGVLHGQRASGSVRSELVRLPGVEQIWNDLSARFQSGLGVDCALDWNSTQYPFTSGHPKLDKLKELLCTHFRSNSAETRAIVFSQFRDSVDEIIHMLKPLRPLVRPVGFIGQGAGSSRSPVLPTPATDRRPVERGTPTGSAGISQRAQIRVMEEFRQGIYNTLVSTCVGEEGLDVGSVDLIICFDAFKSPIRLMQRLGRTGRQRLGRIVMLLTEGREERNHAVSLARTSSIHKALLEGNAYKRLAFYPHNPRMVPLNISPLVKLEHLELPVVGSAAVSSNEKKTPKTTKKSIRKDTNVTLLDFPSIHSLTNLKIRSIYSSALLSCRDHSSVDIPEKLCLTRLYNVTSRNRLDCTREFLQSRLTTGEPRGPSSSSRHLLAVLRLIELRRRGVTRLSFHALGLRSVDVDAPLNSILEDPESSTVSELTQHSTSNLSPPAEPKVIRDKPVNLVTVSVSAPKIVKGLVSQAPLFLPNPHGISEDVKEMMRELLRVLDEPRDKIDSDSLQKIWTNLTTVDSVEDHVTVPPSTTASVSRHSVASSNSAKCDSSILETVPDTMWNTIDYMTLHEGNSGNSPTSVSKHLQNSLAAAFRVTSSGRLCAGIAARSTPLLRHVPEFNFSQSTTQVNLTNALAMLDNSTVRLDVSALMETGDEENCDEVKFTGDLGSNAVARSAIFSGPRCAVPSYCSKSALQFETTLILSDDFGEAFLKPTQVDPSFPTKMPSLTPHDHSSPSDSLHGAELSYFPSQISWSPIGMQDDSTDHTDMPTSRANGFPSCVSRDHVTSNSTQHVSVSPPRKVRRSEGNTGQNPDISDSSPLVIRSRSTSRHMRGRHFLLTQAEVSKDDSADDFDDHSLDAYEESFIDDDCSSSEAETKLDSSAMIGVYLRSLKSPSRGLSDKIPFSSKSTNGNRRRNEAAQMHFVTSKKIISRKAGRFLFSQIPETDDYEIDSFCVSGDESDELEHRSPGKKHRRRIIIDSD